MHLSEKNAVCKVSKQKPLCIHQTQKWPISIINCQFSQSCNVQNNQPWAACEKMFSTDLLSCVVSLCSWIMQNPAYQWTAR